MDYVKKQNMNKNFDLPEPRQLFVTKNPVLRGEVERSFHNMGIIFRKRSQEEGVYDFDYDEARQAYSDNNENVESDMKFPLFLTASEWLNVLGE
jgi:hypothetical protein